MEHQTEDNAVLMHIKQLTEKGARLYSKSDPSDQDLNDLHTVKTELDQYWDLLRQRRAFRNAGEDPSRAHMRSVDTIKNYKK